MMSSVAQLGRHARWLLWLLDVVHRAGHHLDGPAPDRPERSTRVRRLLFRYAGARKAPTAPTLEHVLIAQSGMFDPDFYLASAPDLNAVIDDPMRHFLQHGDVEGRQPSAAFDATLYLALNPDVQASRSGALSHFLRYGIVEGRLLAVDEPPRTGEAGLHRRDPRTSGTPPSAGHMAAEVAVLHRIAAEQALSVVGELVGLVDPLEFELYRARIGLQRATLRNEDVLSRLQRSQADLSTREHQQAESDRRCAQLESTVAVLRADLLEVEREASARRDQTG